ncbi:helix-turn-helix domain-containing protein [Photobacterium nomapromontoriensis]|uniref:helix-turn-helix domain-containing protein n=1 Tax=Photobacterium nomapromontoriensis TaxID=2910237 RepID=UPI003D0B4BE6
MNTTERRKKAGMATGQEQSDWHPADIKAALDKVGWSLRQLSLHSGLSANAVGHALRRQYPRAELIIASAIGYKPYEIWPTRYNSEGHPKKCVRKRGAKIPHNLIRQSNKAEENEKPLSEVTDD